MNKTVSGIVLILLLTGMFALAFDIQPAKAIGTIYIRDNGSVDPPTAPILRNGDLYTLTGNIVSDTNGIVIERSNMVLDGAGYTIQGQGNLTGIGINGRSNVTVKNMEITAFWYGIYLEGSSNNNIVGNNITANTQDGIKLFVGSSNNYIIGNNVTANGNYGITIRASSNNILRNNNMVSNKYSFFIDGGSLSEFIQDVDVSNTVNGKPIYYWINKQDMAVPLGAGYVALINCTRIAVQDLILTNNGQGVLLAYTTNSAIAGNNITANYRGVSLKQSSNNKFYHNDFVNNTNQVNSISSVNVWDDGYPSGGNYWSNYNGTDLYGGHGQNITGRDGIGDTPYVIDASNRDKYPLMTPHGQPTTLFVPTRYQTIQEAINAANLGDEIFVFSGIYPENVVVNKTISLVGENRNSTIIDGLKIGSVVLVINSDDVLIKGFTIRNSSLDDWYAGIRLYNSNNATITDNTVVKNNFGILATNSWYSHVSHNNLSFNLYGGKFNVGSQNGAVIRNIIESNTHYGLSFDDSSNNFLIISNMLKANEYGIIVNGSTSAGTIYHNNFINNTHQVGGNPISTSWNNSYPSGGNFWSNYSGVDLYHGINQNTTGSDGIGDTPYIINATNRDNYPLMNLWTNIAITKVIPSHTVVGQGYSISIDITIENQGYAAATFNITAYASTTVIGMEQITLMKVFSSTVSFVWNTSGFAKGNYTISAIATTVLGETDIADNNRTGGWILIAKAGDFGGPVNFIPTFFAFDGVINGNDLALFIQCYKKLAGNAQYLADLGGPVNYVPTFFKVDGVVDGYDVALFIRCYKGLGPLDP